MKQLSQVESSRPQESGSTSCLSVFSLSCDGVLIYIIDISCFLCFLVGISISSPILCLLQANVPHSEGHRRGPGAQPALLRPDGHRAGRGVQVQVLGQGVGPGGEGRASNASQVSSLKRS